MCFTLKISTCSTTWPPNSLEGSVSLPQSHHDPSNRLCKVRQGSRFILLSTCSNQLLPSPWMCQPHHGGGPPTSPLFITREFYGLDDPRGAASSWSICCLGAVVLCILLVSASPRFVWWYRIPKVLLLVQTKGAAMGCGSVSAPWGLL